VADGFVDLLMDLFARLNIMRWRLAPHSLVLKVGIEPVREFLVLSRVADEAGIELNWSGAKEGW
jgi:hypothetical protein